MTFFFKKVESILVTEQTRQNMIKNTQNKSQNVFYQQLSQIPGDQVIHPLQSSSYMWKSVHPSINTYLAHVAPT